jgi:hypothetical protein
MDHPEMDLGANTKHHSTKGDQTTKAIQRENQPPTAWIASAIPMLALALFAQSQTAEAIS